VFGWFERWDEERKQKEREEFRKQHLARQLEAHGFLRLLDEYLLAHHQESLDDLRERMGEEAFDTELDVDQYLEGLYEGIYESLEEAVQDAAEDLVEAADGSG
jgi:hypothetical protein